MVYKKKLFQIDDFRFFFHRIKNVIPCTYSAPFVSPNLLYTY